MNYLNGDSENTVKQLHAILADISGKKEFSIANLRRAHSINFYSFLRELGLLRRSADVHPHTEYSPEVCDVINGLERSFSMEVDAMRDRFGKDDVYFDRDDLDVYVSRMESISARIGELSLSFTADSGIDVAVVEGNAEDFKVQSMMPKAVMVCENAHFLRHLLHPVLGPEDHARLFLPSYSQQRYLNIDNYEIPGLVVSSKDARCGDDSVGVRLMLRNDLLGGRASSRSDPLLDVQRD